jgi:hypothetical protein
MDPYIEGSYWTSFHFSFCAEIARQLSPRLRPRYLALTERRFVTDSPDHIAVTTANVYPDVSVFKISSTPLPEGAAVALAPAPTPSVLRLPTIMSRRVPHHIIEIREAADRSFVTSIEVFSPVNKEGVGRKRYLKKRDRILLSTVHLLEIDLLREGKRVPMTRPLPPTPYFVLLSRDETRPISDVWPIALNQSLPTVPVPLLEPDPDVLLDLQLAFTNTYDVMGLDLALDYTQPPTVPLSDNEAAWAAQCVANFKPVT